MGGTIANAYFNHPENVSGIIYTATYCDGISASSSCLDTLFAGAEIPSKCVEFYTAMGLSADIALEAAKWPVHCNADALLDYTMARRLSTCTYSGILLLLYNPSC